MACIISSLFIRNYAAAIAVPFPTRFLGPHGPREGSNTILNSKPNCFIGNKLAQIWAQSQFFPGFGHPNPAAIRCYLTGKPECPSSAPPGSGGPGERLRPQLGITNHTVRLWENRENCRFWPCKFIKRNYYYLILAIF